MAQLNKPGNRARNDDEQEQLDGQMHAIRGEMISKGWQYLGGVREDPMVDLLPVLGRTKEIRDPPRLNFKIEPHPIAGSASPHQPDPLSPIREREQKNGKKESSDSYDIGTVEFPRNGRGEQWNKARLVVPKAQGEPIDRLKIDCQKELGHQSNA